jgi:NAD(P)H-dependent flavin oxidoreductase YrpB (nitropropane dioxygenase family)
VTPEVKKKLFAAGADDAILTKTVTGKPCRTLRNKFSDTWDNDESAPKILSAPSQVYLWWAEGRTRVERVRNEEFLTYPVGQIVADMNEETSVKEVVRSMMDELVESKERMDSLLG